MKGGFYYLLIISLFKTMHHSFLFSNLRHKCRKFVYCSNENWRSCDNCL